MAYRSGLVAIVVLAAACAGNGAVDGAATSSSTDSGGAPVRILALGDSYTVGEGVEPNGRWPEQLAARLVAEGTPVTVDYVAGSGWNTRRLAGEIGRAELDPPYDLVTVQIGVNDHFAAFGTDRFDEGLAAVLDEALRLSGDRPDRVLVVSLPDWTVTPRGAGYEGGWRSLDMEPFGAILQEHTADRGMPFADITPLSRRAATDPSLVADDELHPSAEQYRAWVDEVILPALRQMMG
jgi:lysophospholipase L1-like esterase